MLRTFLATLLLVLAGVTVAVPGVAADHCITPSNPPQAWEIVQSACHASDVVVDYIWCYLTTAPINWADCV